VGGSGLGKVYAALLAVQCMFAGHYLAAKVLLVQVPPPAWAGIRLVVAALIFAGVHFAQGGRRIAWRDHARLAVLAFFGVVVNQICFIEGLSRTTPAHSSLICTTIPVATLLFAALLGRERLRGASGVGIALALAGVLVLLRVDRLEIRAEWFVGDVLTLINASSFAFFLVISRDTIRRLGAVTATAGLLGWGALGALVYGAADALALPREVWTPQVLALAVYIVLFPTVLAYFLNYWALARVESSQVALFIYLQPILAGGLSVAFLGEVVTGRLVASSVLVFGGVLFAARGARPA
jgi:drug/metabolite transporter (DMT)-like permease